MRLLRSCLPEVAFLDLWWLRMHAGLSLKMNHEFSLSDLPSELSAVLRDYDVDNSGSVSVAELVGGAQLMRQQAKKVRTSRYRTLAYS